MKTGNTIRHRPELLGPVLYRDIVCLAALPAGSALCYRKQALCLATAAAGRVFLRTVVAAAEQQDDRPQAIIKARVITIATTTTAQKQDNDPPTIAAAKSTVTHIRSS